VRSPGRQRLKILFFETPFFRCFAAGKKEARRQPSIKSREDIFFFSPFLPCRIRRPEIIFMQTFFREKLIETVCPLLRVTSRLSSLLKMVFPQRWKVRNYILLRIGLSPSFPPPLCGGSFPPPPPSLLHSLVEGLLGIERNGSSFREGFLLFRI